jgi:hypothetical protein
MEPTTNQTLSLNLLLSITTLLNPDQLYFERQPQNLRLTGTNAGNTLANTLVSTTAAITLSTAVQAGNDNYLIGAESDHSLDEMMATSGTADEILFASTTENENLSLFAGDTLTRT